MADSGPVIHQPSNCPGRASHLNSQARINAGPTSQTLARRWSGRVNSKLVAAVGCDTRVCYQPVFSSLRRGRHRRRGHTAPCVRFQYSRGESRLLEWRPGPPLTIFPARQPRNHTGGDSNPRTVCGFNLWYSRMDVLFCDVMKLCDFFYKMIL